MSGGGGIPIIGGMVSAYGDSQSTSAAVDSDNYNATQKDIQATDSLNQASEQARIQMDSALQAIGSSRANYGASGVQSNTGSALAVLQKSAQNAEMDSLNIKHAGDMKAWADEAGAAIDRQAGSNLNSNLPLTEISDVLGGASKGINSTNASIGNDQSSNGGNSYAGSSYNDVSNYG